MYCGQNCSFGKNFYPVKFFVGENICHQAKISSLFPNEIFAKNCFEIGMKKDSQHLNWNHRIVYYGLFEKKTLSDD